MERKVALIPFSKFVVEKTMEHGRFSESEKALVRRVRDCVDDVILTDDPETSKALQRFAGYYQPEPVWVTGVRSLMRPVMTLLLSVVFVVLIFAQAGVMRLPGSVDPEVFEQVFTVFLAIYGPIIGFWFGERTAIKSRQPA